MTANVFLDPAARDPALLDPDFLGSASPVAIDWLVERAGSDPARAAGRAIRRVLSQLNGAKPAERLAYLLFAARTADAPELAAAIESSGRPLAWVTEWARWRPSLPTRRLNGVIDPPRAVATGRLCGRDVVAAVFAPAGRPGKRALGAWVIAYGDELEECRQVRLDAVDGLRCLALGTVAGLEAGGEVIVVGYDDGKVHVLDASARTVLSRLAAHSGPVVAVGVLAAGDRTVVVSAGTDGTVRVSDPAGGASLRTIQTGAAVGAAAFGLVGDRPVAVTGGGDGVVRCWDAISGQPFASPVTGHDGPVTAVALGAALSVVVSGGADGTVRVWDAVRGAPVGDPLAGHAGAVTALACVPVGGCPTVVSGGADRTVRFWHLAESSPLYRLYASGPVDALAAGVHGGVAVLVVAARAARPVCYDLSAGFPLPGPPDPDRGPVHALATGEVAGRPVVAVGGGTAAFDTPITGGDPDPRFVRRGVADVLDLATGAVVASVAGHDRYVAAVALGQTGQSTVLATAGAGTIRLWDAATGTATAGPLPDIPDAGKPQRWRGRLLVFGAGAGHLLLMADGTTRLVRIDENTGEQTRTDPMAFGFWSGIDGRPLGASTVVGLRDVSALASGEINGHLVYGVGHRDGTVVVFFDGGVPGGQPPLELPPVAEYEPKAVTAIAFGVAADRQLIAVARCERVDLVDCTTGKPAGLFHGHDGRVRAIAFGRAGGRSVIVTGGADGTVRLWDPAAQRADARGRVRPAIIGHIDVDARVNALACPGGADRVVIGTDSGVVAITSDERCRVLSPCSAVTNDEASTFGTHFDGGMPVPPLLAAFTDWLAAEGLDRWLGDVADFAVRPEPLYDSVVGDDDAFDVVGPRLGSFLDMADGNLAALWDHGGATPAVVYLESEGQHSVLAPSLEAFLLRWSAGDDGGLLPGDEELCAPMGRWLADRGVRPRAEAPVPDFRAWLDEVTAAAAAARAQRIAREPFDAPGPDRRAAAVQALVDRGGPLLGGRSDEPAVAALLADLGIDVRTLRSDVDWSTVQLPDVGVELHFEWPWGLGADREYDAAEREQLRRKRVRTLRTMTVYAAGVRGTRSVTFAGFPGRLPHALALGAGGAAAAAALDAVPGGVRATVSLDDRYRTSEPRLGLHLEHCYDPAADRTISVDVEANSRLVQAVQWRAGLADHCFL